MNEFSERIRDAAQAQAQRSSDARAPRELRRAVGRARILRFGGAAGVAAVAIGAVGAAGAGFTGIGASPEPSPSASVDLSIDSTIEYATVPFPESDVGLGVVEESELCGQPAPQSVAEDEDFSFGSETPLTLELDPTTAGMTVRPEDANATVTFTYSGAEDLRAFVDAPHALFLRDGEVVGWDPMMQESPLITMTPGYSDSQLWRWGGYVVGCDHGGTYGPLEPGEYETVLVTSIRMDEPSAAIHSLEMQGYTLPPVADAPAFREGGYECENSQMYFGATPLTCVPNALPGVEFDYEALTARVPYESDYYSRDLDLTHVSPPITVTLLDESDQPDTWDYTEPPTYEPGTVPACGDIYADGSYGVLAGVWNESTSDVRDIDERDTLTPSLWRFAFGWTSAEVEVPQAPRLWITRAEDVEVDEEDGGSWLYEGHRIVGWIDTTAVGGTTVSIDRYQGPAPWPLTVSGLEWCDGAGEPGAFDGAFIAEPASIATSPDGAFLELDALAFRPENNFFGP
ncbi:hypothetical protein ACNI3K_01240 [Demequina sp. SO4-13]|uniref:hypothetical protein n=1 Tax=Demequina sp. SO4-13 TaxID=3401027 RepID=UPI003AF5FC0C